MRLWTITAILAFVAAFAAPQAMAAPSVSLSVVDVSETGAQLILDGDNADAVSCTITATSSATDAAGSSYVTLPEQSCADWMGGPRAISYSGLTPGVTYKVSVVLTGPFSWVSDWTTFTTVPEPSLPEPSRSPQTFSLRTFTACSVARLNQPRNRCRIGSKPVAVVLSEAATAMTVCARSPLTSEHCTREMQIAAGERRVVGLNQLIGRSKGRPLRMTITILTSDSGPSGVRVLNLVRPKHRT